MRTIVVVLVIPSFALANTLSVTDLGTLGGDRSRAHAINNVGQVVGEAQTATGDWRAFIWDAGTMTDLGLLPGWAAVGPYIARDINDVGQVVGDAMAIGFRWEDGVFLKVKSMILGYGINAQGDVVGYGFGGSAFNGGVYSQGGGRVTGASPATGLFSINSNSQTAATVINGTGNVRAAKFDVHGHFETIPTLGGNWNDARKINEHGVIIGQSQVEDRLEPYMWDGGALTALNTVGYPSMIALGINDLDQVVGSGPAFFWDRGVLTEINSMIANSGWDITAVSDINNLGQMVGWGIFDPDGVAGPILPVRHSVLLQQHVPGPSLGTLSTLVLIALVSRRTRQRQIRRNSDGRVDPYCNSCLGAKPPCGQHISAEICAPEWTCPDKSGGFARNLAGHVMLGPAAGALLRLSRYHSDLALS